MYHMCYSKHDEHKANNRSESVNNTGSENDRLQELLQTDGAV
jgi:hypothetical protein